MFRCTKVSTKVGDFPIYVEEVANENDKEDDVAFAAYYFGKFPYGFFLDNFRAEPPVIKHNDITTLKWDGAYGNGFDYSICSSEKQDVKISNEDNIIFGEQSWQEVKTRNLVVDNLTSTTVFNLKVRYKKYLGAVESSEYYLQTIVFVLDSDVHVRNITAESIEIKKIEEENSPSEITVITPGKIDVKDVKIRGILNVDKIEKLID